MAPQDSLILLDAHVHIYPCFDLASFLDAALRNFTQEAQERGCANRFVGVLLLTESVGHNWFARLRNDARGSDTNEKLDTGTWRTETTGEDCSLCVRTSASESLIIIAGRQIVTRENLEVLALCTDASFDDGLPLRTSVGAVRTAAGVPVIPWGAGKWLGKRGEVLRDLLESETSHTIFLGDNSARPKLWKNPVHFRFAREKGIRILPGTDPLPFRSESHRPGSFGAAVVGQLSLEYPGRDVKRILLDPSTQPQPYGYLETTYRFVRNQAAMQLRKRLPGLLMKQ
jgi:hypothetical protein